MRRHFLGLALVTAVSLAGPVAAQSESERNMARRRYAEGQELFEAGQYEAALAAFREAYEAAPHPIPLKSQAECLERLGQYPEAVTLFERYLADRPDAPDADEVRLRISSHRSQPGTLRVSSYPAGASVAVDGQELPLMTPMETKVAPGPHSVVVSLEGYQADEQTFEMEFAGEHSLQFNLVLSRDAEEGSDGDSPGAEADSNNNEPSGEERSRPRISPGFWAMLGITGASLVAGTITGSLALAQQGEFDDAKASGQTRASLEDMARRGRTEALIADISFGLAGAAAIAGLIFLLVHSRPARSANGSGQALSLQPQVLSGGSGLFAVGSF